MPYREAALARNDADAGFAAADGLMALTLVAMLLAVVLNATSTGLKASRQGWERRLSAAEAEYRLATVWPRLRAPGERTGTTRMGGVWRLTAAPSGASPEGLGLCRVGVEVSDPRSGRRTALETVRFCGPRP